MDVSTLGSLSNSSRPTSETSSDSSETNKASSNIKGQDSQEPQNTMIPPVQAPSDLGGEEGSVVTQDNSSSTNIPVSTTESESGTQLDILA